jgi:hypothetical protein
MNEHVTQKILWLKIYESTNSKCCEAKNKLLVNCSPPPPCSTLKYTPTTSTLKIDVILNWKYFVDFYELFIYCENVETHAIEHYPNLRHLKISLPSYKKHSFIPLVNPPPPVVDPKCWGGGIKNNWVEMFPPMQEEALQLVP